MKIYILYFIIFFLSISSLSMDKSYYEESVLKALECCINNDKKEYAYKLINDTNWEKYKFEIDSIREYVEHEIPQIYLDMVVIDGSLFCEESREQIIEIEKRGIELYNEGVDVHDKMDLENAVNDVNLVFGGIIWQEQNIPRI
jgi:hypothetical protein